MNPDDTASRRPAPDQTAALPKRPLEFWRWEPIYRHEGELYLERLRLIACRWFGIYVHWFHESDDDSLHDHPWPFLTVILKGGYWEHTPGPDETLQKRWYRPGAVRFCPANWLHRVEIDPACKPLTVVIRGPQVRPWGFQTPDGWIPWPEYKEEKERSAAR